MDVLNDRGIILLTAHLKGEEVEGGEAAGPKSPAKRDQETVYVEKLWSLVMSFENTFATPHPQASVSPKYLK